MESQPNIWVATWGGTGFLSVILVNFAIRNFGLLELWGHAPKRPRISNANRAFGKVVRVNLRFDGPFAACSDLADKILGLFQPKQRNKTERLVTVLKELSRP